MAIILDHTIVPARDKAASAEFFAKLFGLSYEGPMGPFSPVQVNETLTFDFDDRRQVLELFTQTRSLAGRRFERDLRFHFRNHRPDRVERRDDFFQARRFARSEMRPRMHN